MDGAERVVVAVLGHELDVDRARFAAEPVETERLRDRRAGVVAHEDRLELGEAVQLGEGGIVGRLGLGHGSSLATVAESVNET